MRLRFSPHPPAGRSDHGEAGRPDGPALRVARGVARLAVAHLPAATVLAVGAAVRAVAVLGYPGPLWFGDSYVYLRDGTHLRPGDLRPSGYSIFLWLLKPFHDLTVVVAVQHALGLLLAVGVYALVWRAGRAVWPQVGGAGRFAWRRWLPGLIGAALIAPIVLPTHQVSLEHGLFAETVFTVLLLAALLVVLWQRRMPWWAGALAGLLGGAAAVTRTVGLPLLALLLLGMLVRRAGWRAVVAAVVAVAAPIVGYMFWFQSVWGDFATSKTSGIFLYGRVAGFANCAVIEPDARLAALCPRNPDSRVAAAYSVMWTENSPFLWLPGGVTGKENNELASEFAREAILAQPGDYVRVVIDDTLRSFEWNRTLYPTPWTQLSYVFPQGERWTDEQQLTAEQYAPGWDGESRVVQPWAGRMLHYQSRIWMPGTVLGVIFLAGLAAPLLRVRVPGRRRNRRAVLDWVQGPMIAWGIGLGLLVVPAATADFDYRYVLPAVPFACLALGLAVLTRRPAFVAGPRPPVTAAAAEAPEPVNAAEPAGDAALAVAVEPSEPGGAAAPAKPPERPEPTENPEFAGH